MEVEYWVDLVRPFVAGRKVILAGAPLAAYATTVKRLCNLGADSVFLIASGQGTGELPSPDDAAWVVLDIRVANLMDDFRKTRQALTNPPGYLLDALDDWDPEHQAMLMGTAFTTFPDVAGRQVWGGRPPAWEALEDKVVVDGIWEGAGLTTTPSMVVPAKADEIGAAFRRLDRGSGAGVVGDASEGFNGGAEYFRWVRTADQVAEAVSFFSAHCRTVRVMPFLEGIPCSIHGIVFPEKTVAFRPCELVMLRQPDAIKLVYGGAATFWDPAPEDRTRMREASVRVGEHLREHVDYRGAFTVDGIMTEDGFRPTELNTRMGAALGLLSSAVDHLPTGLIQRALIERVDADYRPDDFELVVVEAADANRLGGRWTVLTHQADSTEGVFLVRDGQSFDVVADEPEHPAGKIMLGPSALGSFLRFSADPDHTPSGPSVAPLVVDAFAAADRYWDTGIGRLEPGRPVR